MTWWRRILLQTVVWLTSAATLVAGAPHVLCQCARGARESSAPQTDGPKSCCCCPDTNQEENSPPSCCSITPTKSDDDDWAGVASARPPEDDGGSPHGSPGGRPGKAVCPRGCAADRADALKTPNPLAPSRRGAMPGLCRRRLIGTSCFCTSSFSAIRIDPSKSRSAHARFLRARNGSPVACQRPRFHPTIPFPSHDGVAMSNDRFEQEGGLRALPGLGFWGKAWWWFHFLILVKIARLRFLAVLARHRPGHRQMGHAAQVLRSLDAHRVRRASGRRRHRVFLPDAPGHRARQSQGEVPHLLHAALEAQEG